MKQNSRLPTLIQLEQAKELLASQLVGKAAITHRTGLRLADVFRIARTTLHANDQPLPGSPKAVAERLRCFTGNA